MNFEIKNREEYLVREEVSLTIKTEQMKLFGILTKVIEAITSETILMTKLHRSKYTHI